ncbi:hypothetical protein SFRURICE_011535 [Spodoptera frugiperda]|nr:hypothetical protein SFRURICE_011535 [Spodoptera frugiperda]
MSPSPLSPASNPQNPARAPAGRVRMRTEHSTPRTRAEKHLFSHSTQHTAQHLRFGGVPRAEKHLFSHSTQHTAHISALVESRPHTNTPFKRTLRPGLHQSRDVCGVLCAVREEMFFSSRDSTKAEICANYPLARWPAGARAGFCGLLAGERGEGDIAHCTPLTSLVSTARRPRTAHISASIATYKYYTSPHSDLH